MDQLTAHITKAHRLWTAKMSTRASRFEQVELETRLGVTGKQTGTKELYWENAYYPIRDIANKRVRSTYVNKILNDGLMSYRQRNDVWQIKMAVATYDDYDLWMKVAVSIESPSHGPSILEYGEIDNKHDVIIRSISRHSFYVGKSARVDFSKTYTSSKNKESGLPSFEIEVEYIHSKESTIDDYIKTVLMVHKFMFKTSIIFERSSLIRASAEVNSQLSVGSNKKPLEKQIPHTDRSYFSEAKTLDISSLTMKAMILKQQYIIGHKIDGDRIFYLATTEGGFGVYPPNRAAKYSDSEYVKSSGLTVIDGELYDNKLYYIDALFIEGEDLRNLNHTGRHLKFQEWKSRMTIETIGVELREKAAELLTPEKFFVQIRKFVDTLNTQEFSTDGLTFTPHNLMYKDLTLDTREIFKWKPVITMDFKVLNGQLYYAHHTTGDDVVFVGSAKKAFTGEIDMGSIVYTPGSIVEFEFKDENLVAVKIRPEKLGPNREDTIMDNWEKTTINPVTSKTLMCRNNALMRKFHGRIKNNLFAQGGGGVLLDIGSGRGGDFNKWKINGYTQILCVEPDNDNIAEFNRRLKNEPIEFQDKVKLLKARGQDTKIIRDFVTKHLGSDKSKVNAVSMMDSLTFFFAETSLKKLAATIKSCLRERGVFLWKALDGDKAKKAFAMIPDNSRLTFGDVDYLEATTTNKVFVNIEPHVRGEEYYTDINLLKSELNMKGDVLHAHAEHELLSDDYRKLSSLYAYGVFTYGNVVTVPDGVINILCNGKLPVGTLNFTNEGNFDSCIEAIEHLFTQRLHVNLISSYFVRANEIDTDYIQATDMPRYTRFETAHKGYFVEEFFSKTVLVNERRVLSDCDIQNDECSLAFASLLGLDVFIIDEEGNIINTNSIIGSSRPYIDVIYAEDRTYYVSDVALNSSSSRNDTLREDVPNIMNTFPDTLGKGFKLTQHLPLTTPVLLRCAYNTNIKSLPARLYCIANYLAGIAGQKFSERIMDDYNLYTSRYTFEDIQDTILEYLDVMNAEH